MGRCRTGSDVYIGSGLDFGIWTWVVSIWAREGTMEVRDSWWDRKLGATGKKNGPYWEKDYS